MRELSQLLNQTVIYGFSSVIARVLNFLLVPLYTVMLIPSEYAVVSEMYAYAAFFMVLGSFGMETTFFRFVSSKKMNVEAVFSTSFWAILFNSSLILTLLTILNKNIASLINHNTHPEYILFFSVIIFIDLLLIIPFALLRHYNHAVKFSVLKTINIFLNIFFNIFFLLLCPALIKNNISPNLINLIYDPGMSVSYIFISNLLASSVTLIFLAPTFLRNLQMPDYSIFRQMIKYAWPILIAGLAFVVNESADKILIKYLLPKGIAMRELGIYSACYKLTIFLTLFTQAYRFAAEPFFFNQYNKPNAKKIYALMMRIFMLFSLAIFLFVTLYIDYIKLILRSELYHEGIKIIPIVLLANIFLGAYYNLSVWYKVINKTFYAAIISSIGAILTITLNFILVPRYGYIGAAWSTLACYGLMFLISLQLSKRHYIIPYEMSRIISYFLIAGIIFSVSFFFPQTIIVSTVLFFIYAIFALSELKKIMNLKKDT